MTPEQQEAHIRMLHDAIVEIRAILNDGLKATVLENKTELKSVNGAVQVMRDQLSQHVAKEEVIFEIYKRSMNAGLTVTAGLVAVLLAIIGWLLTHPNTWINP